MAPNAMSAHVDGCRQRCSPLAREVEALTEEDPEAVTECVATISSRMRRAEETHLRPEPDYMEAQAVINARMRATLVDWLFEVRVKYNLLTDTLFQAVSLIDRYLSQVGVGLKSLQLVGTAAMHIASKCEEPTPLEVRDFVHISNNAYSREDIRAMECRMLTTLGFSVACPTASHFLDRLLYLQSDGHRDEVLEELAEYIVTFSLLDVELIRYPPSHLAAAALLLGNELLGRYPVWSPAMTRLAWYEECALRPCVDDLHRLLATAPTSSLQTIQKRYAMPEHCAVSTIQFSRHIDIAEMGG